LKILNTMDHPLLFSVQQTEKWIREIEADLRDIQYHIPLDKEHLLEEAEVCKLLNVTPRTILTYRKQRYFRYIKIGGRVYYIKFLLFLDLLKLSTV